MKKFEKSESELALFAHQCYLVSLAGFGDHSWTEAQYREHIEQETSVYYFEEYEGEIIAFVSFQVLFDEAELINIVVSPAFQKQKIGERLLIEALIELKKIAMKALFLEVRKSNLAAQHLYRKLEFESKKIELFIDETLIIRHSAFYCCF